MKKITQKEALLFLRTIEKTINEKVDWGGSFRFNIVLIDAGIRIIFPTEVSYYLNAKTEKQRPVGTLVMTGETIEDAVSKLYAKLFSDGRVLGIPFYGNKVYLGTTPRFELVWDYKVFITCDENFNCNIEVEGVSEKRPVYYEPEPL